VEIAFLPLVFGFSRDKPQLKMFLKISAGQLPVASTLVCRPAGSMSEHVAMLPKVRKIQF